MNPKSTAARVLALFSIFALAGCGYGTTSRTAKDIKSLHVPFFQNETAEPNLEITITENIISNLVSDNTLKVTGEGRADAVLEGRITGFENRPFSFNSELNAQEYHIVVRVTVSLFNRRTNEPIWQDKPIVGEGSYFLEPPPDGNTFETAVAVAVKIITDRILNMTVQDW